MDGCGRPQFSTDISDVVTRGWENRTGRDAVGNHRRESLV